MTDLRHSQGCPGESVREEDKSDGRTEPEKVEAQVLGDLRRRPTANKERDWGLFEL